jgi:UDP-N-acetylglucosamine 4,6-dehydratase/5-epimerase
MTRFWITLEQGVGFVIRSLELMQGGEVFVPKNPSMRVMDLAKALAPDCKTKIIGIRPGEKLNEVLVSEDEARNAVELDDFYVVKPAHPWWVGENWIEGRPLPEGFRYSSESNTSWLTETELRNLAANLHE